MKLELSSDDSSMGTSLKRFDTMILVVKGSMEKVGYSTNIEVSFRVDKIVTFRFATSIVLRIS